MKKERGTEEQKGMRIEEQSIWEEKGAKASRQADRRKEGQTDGEINRQTERQTKQREGDPFAFNQSEGSAGKWCNKPLLLSLASCCFVYLCFPPPPPGHSCTTKLFFFFNENTQSSTTLICNIVKLWIEYKFIYSYPHDVIKMIWHILSNKFYFLHKIHKFVYTQYFLYPYGNIFYCIIK